MRVAAIFGLGCSAKNLKPFQTDKTIEWRMGMPAAADPVDVVLLFGGDGTIHRHLDSLVRLGLPVLIVPAGSGNDFARALGLRRVRDSREAWRHFCSTHDNVRTIDLGVITALNAGAPGMSALNEPPRYFCCVAGVGLDCEVARRANLLPHWLRGHGGYALALAPTLFRFVPFPMKILAPVDDGAWRVRSDQPTLVAAFANTSTYGGGMKIAPRARWDDGLLDVCVVKRMDPFKLACLFPSVYFGLHLDIRGVKYFQAGRWRVETETPLEVYADGEFVCRTPVEITIQRAALRVIVHPPPS